MKDLIKALQILSKYATDDRNPTNCNHDVFAVTCVDPEKVSIEDVELLDKLGFFVSDSDECFISFRFGSS